MQANANVIGMKETVSLHQDWTSIKEWVRRTFTRERIADIALAAANVTTFGVVLFSLHNAVQTFTMTGLG